MGNTIVHHARYGTQWASIDVQGRVQMMAGSNGGLVAVNNATMGGDPAPGVGKVLHLLYTHLGVQHNRWIPEGSTVNLNAHFHEWGNAPHWWHDRSYGPGGGGFGGGPHHHDHHHHHHPTYPAPYNPAPYNPAPYNPAPYNPAPYNPAPYNPAPYNPAPYNPAPFPHLVPHHVPHGPPQPHGHHHAGDGGGGWGGGGAGGPHHDHNNHHGHHGGR